MISKLRLAKTRRPALGVLLVASLALGIGVAAPASALAAPTYWYSCHNGGAGSGLYEDPGCSKEGGSKAFAWAKLGATPTGLTTHREGPGTGEFVIKFKPLSEVQVRCKTQAASGTIANPAGGAAGTTSLSSFSLTGCSVQLVGGCKVREPVTFSPLTGHMTELGGKTAVEFASSRNSEEPLTELEFVGEKCPLTFRYPLTGSFTGVVDAATSTLTFTAESSKMSSFGGRPATLSGIATLATSAGEAVKIAN